MIKIPETPIDQNSLTYLEGKQNLIDGLTSYEEKVKRGKALWKSKSKSQFDIIRDTLTGMCVGSRRCNYCEDSVADEVEHIKPKDIYPEYTFVWENYLYACGPCNGPKNNHFAVFDSHSNVVEVSRKRGEPVVPVLVGNDVFLNPRELDPFGFIILDLTTFLFVPKPGINSIEKKWPSTQLNS